MIECLARELAKFIGVTAGAACPDIEGSDQRTRDRATDHRCVQFVFLRVSESRLQVVLDLRGKISLRCA
jgi:hypothetical protein